MKRLKRSSVFLAGLGASLVLASCGSDSTGPEDDLYPALSSAVRGDWCVRGRVDLSTVGSSVLNATDCPTGPTDEILDTPVGFQAGATFETWRLRVTDTEDLVVSVSSNLDSVLDVYRIPDISDPSSAFHIDFDDDTNGLDAEIEFTAVPGIEYWVMVSGFDGDELGDYTVTARLAP